MTKKIPRIIFKIYKFRWDKNTCSYTTDQEIIKIQALPTMKTIGFQILIPEANSLTGINLHKDKICSLSVKRIHMSNLQKL
jgi:hypothetical protein